MPLEGPWLSGRVRIDQQQYELTNAHATNSTSPRSDADVPVLWAGGLGDGPFEEHPRNWLAPGWETLTATRAELGPATLLRPHAAHIISDGLSCARLAAEGGKLALSPASMLPPSLHADVDDHLIRIFELAAPHASLLILEDLQRGALRAAPAGQGFLPGPLLADLAERLLPASVPIIVAATTLPEAAAWLGHR